MDKNLEKLKDWLLRNFVKIDEYQQFRRNVIDRLRSHEDRMQRIKSQIDKDKNTDIDIEMFGIKLFRARLMNVTKGILIAVISIGVGLYFIFRFLK